MQDFKKLIVYQEAYILCKDIYSELGKTKEYRLKSQLFGSATSIPANIAEMAGATTSKQMAHKLSICIGEANETEFWLDFCRDASIIDADKHSDFLNRLHGIRKMLISLYRCQKRANGV